MKLQEISIGWRGGESKQNILLWGGGGVGHFLEQHNGKLNNERLNGLPHMAKTQELFHSQAHQTLKNID